jgi:hypothetical protein
MPSRHSHGILLFAALALPCAALEWKTTTVSLTTAPFQTTQDVVFEFKNSGPKPVALLDVQTNCDCLAASADQKIYAPGAAGTIKARFTVGDRSGPYERIITLVTDESPSPVRLIVRIEVPDIATISPRSVVWPANDAAAEKTVELNTAPGLEIVFSEAQATNEAFSASLETVEAGRHYRLHLKPRSTAQPSSAAIRVFGRDKSGHNVIVSAYASVQ